MTQTINLPGGETASFPDEMPKEQIEAVLSSHFKQNQQVSQAEQPQQFQQAPQQPEDGTPIADRINAVGGGLAQGLVKTGAAVGGLLTDPLPQSIQEPVRAAGRAVGQALSPSPNSIPGQAMEQHPNYATGGDIVGQVAPYAIPGIGAGARANAALTGVAGAASTDDGLLNRLEGGTFGLATGKLLEAAGVGVQTGISALRSSDVVKKVGTFVTNEIAKMNQTLTGTPREIGAKSAANVFNMTKQADDELFTNFRSAPGNFKPEIRQVTRQIEDLLDNYNPILTPAQKGTFAKAQEILSQNYSLADLHDVRKLMSSMFSSFNPKLTGPQVSEAFHGLQKTIDDQMMTVAKKAGVEAEYLTANKHFQEKMLPLIKAGTGKVAKALSPEMMKTDPTGAAKVLDEWVDKGIKLDKPNETRAFLNTLDPVGRQAVELRALQRTLDKVKDSASPGLTFRTEISKLNTTAGELFTGENKKILAGTMRVLDEAAPILKHQLKPGEILNIAPQMVIDLANKAAGTLPGQFILKMLGEPGVSKTTVKEFLTKGSAILGGEAGSKLTNSALQINQPQD